MKRHIYISFYILAVLFLHIELAAQSTSPAPYCAVNYANGQCNQPGPSNSPGNFINDFIDDFVTTGGNTNISNIGSGCNGGPGNYMNYCQHYLAVSPGQTIVATLKSGITFAQGFAIFIDWNQDNTFNVPAELVAGTPGVPPAATSTTISFVIPPGQPNGVYRMRVRCVWATIGANIPPCGGSAFGEAEDYNIYVGPVPPSAAVPSGSALVNSPVCVGQALNFTFATTYVTPLTYTWSGPANFGSTFQNPNIFNSQTSASGIYTVSVTNGLCPITRTVEALVVAYPSFTPVASQYTICQGGAVVGTASISNVSAFTYSWSSAAVYAGVIGQPTNQVTSIKPALLPIGLTQGFAMYSVKVSPTLHPVCAVTKTLGITINNPLTPTLTMPPPLCDIFSPVQLTATPGGGTWSANPAVTQSGIYNPAISAIGVNTVMYSVSVGTCIVFNTNTLSVSLFHTPALSSSISLCEQDPRFNLMNIVQDPLTGHWTGPNVDLTSHFDPSGLATGNYSLTHHTFSTPDSLVCPSSTVLVVPVYNPPIPVIDPILPLCDNSPTVTLTASPPGGIWTGNSGVLVTGVRIPSLNTVGSNTVYYTAGIGTCVATAFKTFTLSRFNTASFTGTISPLCVTSAPVNLMNIAAVKTGTWSGVSVNSANGSFNPMGLPTGVYPLVYNTQSSPDVNLCPDSQTITVSVLNPKTPTITPAGPVCDRGMPVQLKVNPPVGTWIPSPFLTSGGIFTPSLAPIGVSPVQYVIGTPTCNAFSSGSVSVEAFVPATVTGKINDLCNNNFPVNLNPLTSNLLGNWTGAGVVARQFDPALSGAGNFILTYHTASSPSGLCPDQATLAVNVFSLAAPSIATLEPLCNISMPRKLVVSPLGGVFEGNVSGSVSHDGLFNPALATIGPNIVNYTVSVGPCISYTQTTVSVEAFVSAGFGKMPDPAYCNNQFPFNLNSFVLNEGGSWSGGAALLGPNMFDPSLADIGPNMFVHRVSSSPSHLCPDSDTLYINVKKAPDITAVSTSYGDCVPFEVTLHTPGTNYGHLVWNISDGSKYTENAPTHIFKVPGNYSVLATWTDDDVFGCTTQTMLPASIIARQSPKADFSVYPDEITIENPVASLINQSVQVKNNRYVWEIQGQDSVYEVNPKVKFTKPGSYRVTLTATAVDGCASKTSKMVEIKNEFKVYIPNSFTPNFDGLNDVFIPVFTAYGLDVKTFEMEIFDRWGHLLYRTKDITKGWDGMHSGNEIAKEDNYVYRIHFKDLDGQAYSRTGYLSLLK